MGTKAIIPPKVYKITHISVRNFREIVFTQKHNIGLELSTFSFDLGLPSKKIGGQILKFAEQKS